MLNENQSNQNIVYSSFLLLFVLEGDHEGLVECLFHAKIGGEDVNGLSPPVFLVSSYGSIVCLFSFGFSSFVEMAISLSFLIVLILAVLQLIQPVRFLYGVVLVFKDREIVGVRVGLHESLHFDVGSSQQSFTLFLT